MALDPLPDPLYLLELRSTRVAAAELLLLAVAGGTLGAFVVLRRLAFYTHAVGTATFPGVVVAEAARFSPRLAALGVAVAYAGGVERAGRAGRDPGGAATGLMLVLALAGGTILASDVFESGAGVDRLLFGSAVALSDADVAIARGAPRSWPWPAALLLGRAWTAVAFDPDGAPGLGVPGRRARPGAAAGGGRHRRGRAARGRLAAGDVAVRGSRRHRPPAHRLGAGAGGRVGRRGGGAGPARASTARSGWTCRPGPAIAVLGAAAYVLVAVAVALGPARVPSRGARVSAALEVREPGRRLRRRPGADRRLVLRRARHRRCASWAPTAAARPRCSAR